MDIISNILETARQSLETATTNPRYRLGTNKEQAVRLITAAYRKTVTARGITLLMDEKLLKRIESAAEWLTGDHKTGLLLYGGVGNGKSTLVNAISESLFAIERALKSWENNIANQDYRNVETRCPARSVITSSTPATFSSIDVARLAETSPKGLDHIKGASFLILDDIGCEPPSVKVYGNEISPVSDILYYRYDKQLPTILTSNLDKAGLKEFYGPRIADRLEEMCDCIGFNNKSYRK